MNRPLLIAVALMSLAPTLRAQEGKGAPTGFDRLVRQLGSNSFQEREEATRRLSTGGEESLGPLRKARAAATDLEVRHRLGRVIAAVELHCYGPQVTFAGHTRAVCAVALSPDGKHVLTGGFEGRMCLWDAATGKEVRRFRDPVTAKTAAFSPDGGLAAACGDGSGGRAAERSGKKSLQSHLGGANFCGWRRSRASEAGHLGKIGVEVLSASLEVAVHGPGVTSVQSGAQPQLSFGAGISRRMTKRPGP